jgi:DNA-binding transcriptional MerR regulator
MGAGNADDRRWKVGDLASSAGLTVRTLHHFDEIGLLRPAERTEAGHRLYTADDVRRLYRILTLRHLGIPLVEIAASLDGDPGDLAAAVRQQLAQVEQQINQQQRLYRRLAALWRAIQESREPSVDELLVASGAVDQRAAGMPTDRRRG